MAAPSLSIARSTLAMLCGAALWLACVNSCRADIYSFTDGDGVVHFSDRQDDSRYHLFLQQEREAADAIPVPVAANAGAYARTIAEAAQQHQVDAALLHAVIAVESNYNPRAVSPKGAKGMMQLMPATARAMGVTDPLNAAQNIRGGAKYLRQLLDRFANNTRLALAAYNAGPAVVAQYGNTVPPIAETRSYVPAVLQRYAQLAPAKPSDDAQ